MSKSIRFLALAACLLIGLVAPAMAADLENTLYLDVPAGRVVIELLPECGAGHRGAGQGTDPAAFLRRAQIPPRGRRVHGSDR